MLNPCRKCEACQLVVGYPNLGECRRHAPQVVLDGAQYDRFPKVVLDNPGCLEFTMRVKTVFEPEQDNVAKQPVADTKVEQRAISESMGMTPKPAPALAPIPVPPVTSKREVVQAIADKAITKKPIKPEAKPVVFPKPLSRYATTRSR